MAATSDEAVTSAQLGYEHAFGSANEGAHYRKLSGASADDASLSLAAGARLWPRELQLGAVLPLRLQHRWLQGVGSSTAFGMGDAAFGLRFRAFESKNAIPSIDLIAGLRVPTGRSAEDSTDPTLADVTGEGIYAPSVGLKLTFEVTPLDSIFVRAEHAFTLPKDVEDRRVNLGDENLVEVGYLRQLSLVWFVGVLADARFTGETSTDGTDTPNSDSRRLRLGVWASWIWSSPLWDATLAVFSDPFWDGAEKNVPFAGVSSTLGMRRVFR